MLDLDNDADVFPINRLPNDLLVEIFAIAAELVDAEEHPASFDPHQEGPLWVRHTFPLVCERWNALFATKDASPLNSMLLVNISQEIYAAQKAADWETMWHVETPDGPRRGLRPVTRARAQDWARRGPVFHASRAIQWAQRRAGSVRELRLSTGGTSENLGDFGPDDLGALVAAVAGPSLTKIDIREGFGELLQEPFWASMRNTVYPVGKLRSLNIDGIVGELEESEIEPLGGQTALEEVALRVAYLSQLRRRDHLDEVGELVGLPRFPESLLSLPKLRRLVLCGHSRIKAIPDGISGLKEELDELCVMDCDLRSLPKELGELSRLTALLLSHNEKLGNVEEDEAFPAELGKMKALRFLSLCACGLRAIPAFVEELSSLEEIRVSFNRDLQIDGSLDFLVEKCPRLREVMMQGVAGTWPPGSLAFLKTLKAKLRARNPNAEVWF